MILLKKKNYLAKNETTTGQNIQIENQKTEIKNLIIDGESSQENEPSPENPSKINSVGYTNLFDKDSTRDGVYIGSDGSFQENSETLMSDFIEIEINENYYISGRTVWSSVALYNSNKTFLERIVTNNPNGVLNITNSRCKYIILNASLSDKVSLKIERRNIPHPYIPFGKYGIEVKTTGKNLFDYNKLITEVNVNSSGSVILDYNANINYVKLESGKTYTISSDSSRMWVISYFIDKPKLNDTGIPKIVIQNSKEYTFTMPEGYNYFVVREYINGTSGEDNKNKKIMLNEGSEATEYTPYQEQTTVLQLNEPLRSLPNGVKDIAYIKNNKLYVDRYVGSVVLNGTENWEIQWSTEDCHAWKVALANGITYPNDFYVINPISSDCFKTYGQNSLINNTGAGKSGICGRVNNNHIIILYNDIKSINDFKIWLSTNNVQVDYQLATPITEELGDITIPELLDGENNISNSENANMKIEYVNYTPEIFEFNTILQSGYRINEQQNLISKKQFVNGKRKKINTSYTDVIINLDLGCFDGNTLGECLTNLTDGEYEYYSLKDKKIKNANFIVTLPELQVDNSACEVFVGDFTATLEKSSDVE